MSLTQEWYDYLLEEFIRTKYRYFLFVAVLPQSNLIYLKALEEYSEQEMKFLEELNKKPDISVFCSYSKPKDADRKLNFSVICGKDFQPHGRAFTKKQLIKSPNIKMLYDIDF